MTSCYSNAHAHVVATTHGTTFSTGRLTFSLAGQPVVVRQIAGPFNIYNYLYTDHLGSVVSMSSSSGVVTSGSRARFYPFGDWRTEPTQTMTDRGFTGHRSNNKGTGDIGLIYMNARFYLPEVGRFVSADSLVPDPANPQSFNRYSYVLNSPFNFAGLNPFW